ncbi:MAG: DUF4837 family protein [Bacteroidota bacterium]
MKANIICGALMVALLSCGERKQNQQFQPSSTGSINGLIVVMENDLWQGVVGDSVRAHFAKPALGLMPEQPILSLTQIPPKVFSGAVTRARSVLYVAQDTLTIAHIKTDLYASPQKIAVVKGTNQQEILVGLDQLAENAIRSYKAVEIKEAQKRFQKSLNREKALQEVLGIAMNIPSAYRVGKQEEGFVWFDRQIPKGTLNVIAYSMPNNSFSNDSTFVNDIVAMRDSIGKRFIPGPDEGTYMITERAFAPYLFPLATNGLKGAEAKGIWEINGYPMAGPFLTHILNDTINQRKVVVEGFAFAPATQKRDYMFELEAILKTVTISK